MGFTSPSIRCVMDSRRFIGNFGDTNRGWGLPFLTHILGGEIKSFSNFCCYIFEISVLI